MQDFNSRYPALSARWIFRGITNQGVAPFVPVDLNDFEILNVKLFNNFPTFFAFIIQEHSTFSALVNKVRGSVV